MSERATSFAKMLVNHYRDKKITFSAAYDVFECAEAFMSDEEAQEGFKELDLALGAVEIDGPLTVGPVAQR